MTSSCTTFKKNLAQMLNCLSNSFLSVLLSCAKTIQEKGFGACSPELQGCVDIFVVCHDEGRTHARVRTLLQR